jgi:hypothetical protein
MALSAFEKPSLAKEFFLKIKNAYDPVAFLKGLVGSQPPTHETEWLDFKCAANVDEKKTKEIWSEALAGFANTQGGVLVWGIDARKDSTTGVDAASNLSLAPNPNALKSRLYQLHAEATDPPVLGVEIEAYAIPNSPSEGFVVCFIPESPFRPHRAEHANKRFLIRVGDDFKNAPVSLLRNLFFPLSRCILIPAIRACSRLENSQYLFTGNLKNIGSATALEVYRIVEYEPVGAATHELQNWKSGPTLTPLYGRLTHPLHPGISVPLFQISYLKQHIAVRDFRFVVRIFARDAEAFEWNITFQESEVLSRTEKTGERRSLSANLSSALWDP